MTLTPKQKSIQYTHELLSSGKMLSDAESNIVLAYQNEQLAREYLKYNPDDKDAKNTLGHTLVLQGRIDEALSYLQGEDTVFFQKLSDVLQGTTKACKCGPILTDLKDGRFMPNDNFSQVAEVYSAKENKPVKVYRCLTCDRFTTQTPLLDLRDDNTRAYRVNV